jgi:hypothetical protein
MVLARPEGEPVRWTVHVLDKLAWSFHIVPAGGLGVSARFEDFHVPPTQPSHLPDEALAPGDYPCKPVLRVNMTREV